MIDTCPIHYWAKETPEHIAVEAGSVRLSYRTFNRWVASLAQQLAREGFVPGDRLVVPAKGSLESLLLAWACLRAGVIFCPLNPVFPIGQQLSLAKRLQAGRVCQTESDHHYPAELTPVSLDFLAEGDVTEPPVLDGNQLCNTIFTSGSSGTPKAVLHRVGNHLASARGSASFIPVDQNSGWLLSLPLFHIGGYAIPFRVFLAGGRVILDEAPHTLAERLEQQAISHLSLVPTQLWRLLKAGFTPKRTQLRELLLGGAAIPAPLVTQMTLLGLTPKVSYGLSEMASQVCTGIPTAPGVVGKPLPGREARVVDGEIQVRGETLFCGYLNNGNLDPALNEESWFATRDKGHFNADGALVVEGRLDNGFISGGENIQPETIEQRLVDHPSIAQALVVAMPHPEWGERPVAFIDWHGEAVSEQAINAWVREALPGFMVPDAWLAWPPGVGFKPSRKQFAELAREQLVNK
ncbi:MULTISPECIES: AMP-binding protein [unclassified Halomonas]|uniref:AMP-binding protein n=1 Tax=unclassified Halomonas TaxID=2609666 RepID=UPI0007D90938|nr:AMP-binding protein [Halomonas sp. ALS9]MBT2786210.1 AMP-binding protein [Halomonas sp. ISL-106]MBT2797232.1 AMP-binding protein [Halomonas sp. ISL-104]OAL58608.1 2-succinylbenzoate-CoA ligase [Halomonas sp. ALS9]